MAKRQRQHPLGNPSNRASNFIEPHGALYQLHDDEDGPFVTNPPQRFQHGAETMMFVSNIKGIRYHDCAFLWSYKSSPSIISIPTPKKRILMNLLHIDSSILGLTSASRQLSSDIVTKLKAGEPGVTVKYRDLAANPVPHLSGSYLAAASGVAGEPDSAVKHDLALGGEVLDEFLAANIVVIGVALYNFTISSQLKAWVDRIVVNGKTFQYTASGPQGLAGGKKVILAVARGGYYGPGSPAEALEHAETYLRGTLGFIGVTDLHVVVAEGLSVGPEERAHALASAAQQIAALSV
jgi:FMN-dependent NADH-azoreductase